MEYKPLKLGVKKSQIFSSIIKTKPNLKQAKSHWKSIKIIMTGFNLNHDVTKGQVCSQV